jgi:hypothetical protein
MSESKGLIFAKSAKKHAGRAKEKVMINLRNIQSILSNENPCRNIIMAFIALKILLFWVDFVQQF